MHHNSTNIRYLRIFLPKTLVGVWRVFLCLKLVDFWEAWLIFYGGWGVPVCGIGGLVAGRHLVGFAVVFLKYLQDNSKTASNNNQSLNLSAWCFGDASSPPAFLLAFWFVSSSYEKPAAVPPKDSQQDGGRRGGEAAGGDLFSAARAGAWRGIY